MRPLQEARFAAILPRGSGRIETAIVPKDGFHVLAVLDRAANHHAPDGCGIGTPRIFRWGHFKEKTVQC